MQAFALNDRRPRLTTTTIVSRRSLRQSPQKIHTRTGAKFHSKSHARVWSDKHRKSFTAELVQSLTAKDMVVCRQTITAKVLHQNWCKVSQKKPWSCVVRQSPQKFHTRAGAKFHRKSHGRVWSDNHRKSFTPELVQSFTAKDMVVCRQTITAKVSHQSWCKVSQQKPWSCVVRQSPQKSHTRTGAKFDSKSHGRVSSDNHRKSFTPELVQSFTAKAMVLRLETIVVVVSLGRLSFRANACNKSLFRKTYVKGLSSSGQI